VPGPETEAERLSLTARVDRGLEVGPTAIVFTYGGDCCESTRQFFDAYDEQVTDLLRARSLELPTVVWADVGDTAARAEIEALAERYGVKRVPTLCLVGRGGEPVEVLEGPLDPETAGQAIARVVSRP